MYTWLKGNVLWEKGVGAVPSPHFAAERPSYCSIRMRLHHAQAAAAALDHYLFCPGRAGGWQKREAESPHRKCEEEPGGELR